MGCNQIQYLVKRWKLVISFSKHIVSCLYSVTSNSPSKYRIDDLSLLKIKYTPSHDWFW